MNETTIKPAGFTATTRTQAVLAESRCSVIEGDCLDVLPSLPADSIDICVTSPPYYNAREYSQFESYDAYISFIANVFRLIYQVQPDTGRLCVNVPDGYGRNPWLPVYADTVKAMQEAGYILRGSIVWYKGTSGGRTSWGSWRSSSNPSLRDTHEMIILAHKQDAGLDNGTEIERDDFLSLTQSVWTVGTESAKRIGHTAPFPVEIPRRLITLLSSEDATVLDPFMGSGTTGVATLRTGRRRFIGIERDTAYATIARRRIYDEEHSFPLLKEIA